LTANLSWTVSATINSRDTPSQNTIRKDRNPRT